MKKRHIFPDLSADDDAEDEISDSSSFSQSEEVFETGTKWKENLWRIG